MNTASGLIDQRESPHKVVEEELRVHPGVSPGRQILIYWYYSIIG